MYEKLFEPIRIGNVKIKNRLVLSPMVVHYAGSRGEVTERMLRYYEERAKGDLGLILTETTIVQSEGRCIIRNPGMYSDELIPGWSHFVDTMHLYGAKVGVQLGHGGNQGPDMLKELVSASAIPRSKKPGRTPRELTIGEVEELIEAWGEAARRAKSAGFDFVEEHGSHGYLITQFCSPLTNRRMDKYGADRDLFAVEILKRIKQKCGDDYPVIYRLNSCEFVKGGITLEDAKTTARKLCDNGIDAIDVTGGTNDSFDYFLPAVYYDTDRFYEFTKNAREIKKVVNVPVISGGLIVEPEQAVQAIEEGYLDMVYLGRAALADPQWAVKARQGRVDDIRKCIVCNDGCVGRLFEGKSVWCSVNPLQGWEYKFGIEPQPAPVQKNVVVVGGGPGGMAAALTAAQRGHQVTLLERDAELGGALKVAAAETLKKRRMEYLIDWYRLQLPKAGVAVRLGQEATAAGILSMAPQAVVLATGSIPAALDTPGAGEAVAAEDVLLGKVSAGNKVVIIGGGFVGCDVALHLANANREITIVVRSDDYLRDANYVTRITIEALIARGQIKVLLNRPLIEIQKTGVVVKDPSGNKVSLAADTVVLAVGREAESSLEQQLRGKVSELYVVGDCVSPRRVMEAVHEAFGAAMMI